MEQLPDDLLLEISNKLDVDAFLTFQSTNRHIRDLLGDRHTGVVEAIARNTFPNQTRLLFRQQNEPADTAWLRDLRYRQLAAIVVEHLVDSDRLSADDELGDTVRRKVAAGWRVTAGFAQIAQSVRDRDNRGVSGSDRPTLLAHAAGLELFLTDPELHRAGLIAFEVAHHWKACINTLGIEELQGLHYLCHDSLPLVFDPFAHRKDVDADRWHTAIPHQSFSMVRWSLWTSFNTGPQVFWRAWWTHGGNGTGTSHMLSHWVRHRWEKTNRMLAYIQKAACKEVWKALEARIDQIVLAIDGRYCQRQGAWPANELFERLSSRTSPIADWRVWRTRSMGEPPVSRATTGVPYCQYIKFGELVKLAGNRGFRMPRSDALCQHQRPKAEEAMENAQAYDEWEDRIINDIRVGRFSLPEA